MEKPPKQLGLFKRVPSLTTNEKPRKSLTRTQARGQLCLHQQLPNRTTFVLYETQSESTSKGIQIEYCRRVTINSTKLILHSFIFACDKKPLKCKWDQRQCLKIDICVHALYFQQQLSSILVARAFHFTVKADFHCTILWCLLILFCPYVSGNGTVKLQTQSWCFQEMIAAPT